MSIDYTALKDELDANTYGYSGQPHPETADLLNEIRAAEQVDAGTLDGQILQHEVDGTEWLALDAEMQRAWATLISAGSGMVNVNHPSVISHATAIWGGGSATLANLSALRTRNGSRAEVLFGQSVSAADVMEARQL